MRSSTTPMMTTRGAMILTALVGAVVLMVVMGMAIPQKTEKVKEQQGQVEEQQEERLHLAVMAPLMSACLFRQVLASAARLLPRLSQILRSQLNLSLMHQAPSLGQ